MEKPLLVAREEFKEKISEVINNSGLPAFVILGELEKLLPLLRDIDRKQLAEEQERWNTKEGDEK